MKVHRHRRYITRQHFHKLPNDDDLINLNISGTKFSILRSLIKDHKNILNVIKTDGIYLRNSKEYFLNRDANVFQSILNFCRYGEYHFPTNICGPLIDRELQSWNIDLDVIEIERCCMGNLMETKSKVETLRKFEIAIMDKDDNSDRVTDLNHGKNALSKFWQWRKIMNHIFDDSKENRLALIYRIFIGLAILLAIMIFVVSSHDSYRQSMSEEEYHEYYKLSRSRHESEGEPSNSSNANSTRTIFTRPLDILETGNSICMTIFTVDLILRLFFCTRIVKFFCNIYSLIDLLSIFPFFFIKIYSQFYDYADFSTKSEHSTIDYITCMKVFIVFRVLRLLRRNRGFKVLYYTMIVSAKEMTVLFLFIGISALCFASIMFFFESHEDFKSIPHGLWWSIITMSTIGYGDIVPKSFPGYVVGALCALCGVLLISLCVPIVVNHFILFYNHSLTIFPHNNDADVDKRKHYAYFIQSPTTGVTIDVGWTMNEHFCEDSLER